MMTAAIPAAHRHNTPQHHHQWAEEMITGGGFFFSVRRRPLTTPLLLLLPHAGRFANLTRDNSTMPPPPPCPIYHIGRGGRFSVQRLCGAPGDGAADLDEHLLQGHVRHAPIYDS